MYVNSCLDGDGDFQTSGSVRGRAGRVETVCQMFRQYLADSQWCGRRREKHAIFSLLLAYKLSGSLVAPVTSGEKRYGALMKAMTIRYCPPLSESYRGITST